MNAVMDDDHEELRQMVRRFCVEKSSEMEVRRLMESDEGYDPAVWMQMATQLGLQGIGIAEEYGGSGADQVALSVVFEEMGRALLCAPYFSTVALAANLLTASGDETAMKDYLPAIAAGEMIATVALAERAGSWGQDGISLQASGGPDSWTLTGGKSLVLDAGIADLILVVARTSVGISVFAVDKNAEGLVVDMLQTLDRTRRQARLTFQSTPARLVGSDGEGWAAVARMLDLAAVSLAAEQLGGARQVLESAIGYAKNRIQFGKTIGSFQVIKHKCAELYVAVEAAKASVSQASWAVATENEDLRGMVNLAKSYCSEVYFRVAAENIQIHGAIGFTWEHPAHLYFKRAKSSELLFGAPAYHRELLAERIGV